MTIWHLSFYLMNHFMALEHHKNVFFYESFDNIMSIVKIYIDSWKIWYNWSTTKNHLLQHYNTSVQFFFFFFITSTYTRFKSKIYNHQLRQVFRTWNLKQQEFVQRNWELLVEALALNKYLLGKMKYIYNVTSLKGHYTITFFTEL